MKVRAGEHVQKGNDSEEKIVKMEIEDIKIWRWMSWCSQGSLSHK